MEDERRRQSTSLTETKIAVHMNQRMESNTYLKEHGLSVHK